MLNYGVPKGQIPAKAGRRPPIHRAPPQSLDRKRGVDGLAQLQAHSLSRDNSHGT